VAVSLLGIIAIVLMLIAIVASFLPFVPGPLMVWAIALVYAVLMGFDHVTWLSAVIMTALMVLGSTTGWWTQALGMKAHGGSCLSIVGALVGGLIGTFLIPVPFVGTLVGLVLGALVLEFARVGEFKKAVQVSSAAVSGYVMSMIVEFGISVLILLVFVVSLIVPH
jgi:uncharacterized protein YqgC (DUF456 family)